MKLLLLLNFVGSQQYYNIILDAATEFYLLHLLLVLTIITFGDHCPQVSQVQGHKKQSQNAENEIKHSY